MKDQLGHHSIKVTVDIYGHLVPGANEAAVDRLDEQAWRSRRRLDRRERRRVRTGRGSRATRRNPRATSGPPERTRGVTDRSVTPREEMVELRGLEPLTPRLPALCSPN